MLADCAIHMQNSWQNNISLDMPLTAIHQYDVLPSLVCLQKLVCLPRVTLFDLTECLAVHEKREHQAVRLGAGFMSQ